MGRRTEGSASDLALDTVRFGSNTDASLQQRWAMVDVAGLLTLSQYEGCTLWLYRRLVELDVLDRVDATFAETLNSRARQVAAHNLAVDAQVRDVVSVLGDLEIPHVLLKGSALRLLMPDIRLAGARITWDVDILVPAESAQGAWESFVTRGYRPVFEPGLDYDRHHHLPPLRGKRGVVVELHTSTSRQVEHAHAWKRMNAGSRSLPMGGQTAVVPSDTELFWHVTTHAIANPRYAFRLRYFQDGAALQGTERVDWTVIAERLRGDEIADPRLVACWMATVFCFGVWDTPEALEDVRAFDIRRALRWRLTVFNRVGSSGVPRRRRSDRVGRLRRLLIDEATGTELDTHLTPSLARADHLTNLGRHVGASAARVGYRFWRAFGR